MAVGNGSSGDKYRYFRLLVLLTLNVRCYLLCPLHLSCCLMFQKLVTVDLFHILKSVCPVTLYILPVAEDNYLTRLDKYDPS